MSKRGVIYLLEDILDAIQNIEDFTSGVSFEYFVNDTKTNYAVIKCFEIIGEASRQIPDNYKKEHKHIHWKSIYAFRNRVIHEYFGVDLEVVWKIIETEIPKLKENIIELKANLTGG